MATKNRKSRKSEKQLAIETSYRKERRRAQSLLRRYIKKGFDVEVDIPKIPKRITEASVRVLAKITPKFVQNRASAPDLQTGEKITYQQYKNRYPKAGTPNQERQRIEQRTPFQWELAIDYVREVVSNYPDKSEEIFLARLTSVIAVYGEERVGTALQKMIDNDEIMSPQDAYNVDAVIAMSNSLIKYLNFDEDILADLWEDINSANESIEYYEGEFSEWQ